MADYREEMLRNIMIGLEAEGIEELEKIKSVLIRSIGEYEITERCTEVAVIDDSNTKLIKLFLDVKRSEGGSQRTRKNRAYTLKRFSDDVGKPFAEISVFDIRLWLANEQNRVCLATANKYRSDIHSMFAWLKNEGFIEKNPAENIKEIKHPKTIKKSFTAVEVDSLKSACKNIFERTLVELLLSSGMRCEELCNLKWEDIDFVTKDIQVIEGKGNKNRITMMDDVTKKYLLEYRDTVKVESVFVFAKKYGGTVNARTPNAVWQRIKKIARNANVKDVYPHRFRRTCATTLYKRGMDVHLIQRLLGHANINTTMIYIDSDMESLRDAYKKCV